MTSGFLVARSFLGILGLVRHALLTVGLVRGGELEEGSSLQQGINVMPLTVRTPHAGFNRLVVSVTVCEPGTTRCATIDNVMVDTGSTGLRLEASSVPNWMNLPAHLGPEQRPMAECLHFLHDDAWGPLVRADLHLGGMTAVDLPIQIIADDQRPQPAACPPSTVRATSNGTLGIGPHLFDCRGNCEQSATRPSYFVDRAGTWTPFEGPLGAAYRLPNPVSRLPAHNNGVVFDLPAPLNGGATEVTGTLTLGVGTAPNNQPGSAHLLPLDPAGQFTTIYGGKIYLNSYIDSGTETYMFEDDQLPRCPRLAWAFCSTPDRWVEATMVTEEGARLPWSVRVGDYEATLARGDGASNGMAVAASPGSNAFVWGAPFFLGKRVAVILDGMNVPGIEGVKGPLYAICDNPTCSR